LHAVVEGWVLEVQGLIREALPDHEGTTASLNHGLAKRWALAKDRSDLQLIALAAAF
jgi:hypothetical protein